MVDLCGIELFIIVQRLMLCTDEIDCENMYLNWNLYIQYIVVPTVGITGQNAITFVVLLRHGLHL